MGVRTYKDAVRVYLDFDGVIADFEGGANEHNLHPSQYKRLAGAYLYLKPMPGSQEAVKKLTSLGYLVFGLTKIPDSNPWAATEKLLWARGHFPEIDDRIIISPDKGAVGTSRDFLIDDHPEWANAHNFPGTVYKFTGDWPATIDFIITNTENKK